MNTPEPEPRGGHPKIELIFQSYEGIRKAGIRVSQNGRETQSDRNGYTQISQLNGGAIYIEGVDYTQYIMPMVQLRAHRLICIRDGWTGRYTIKSGTIDLGSTPHPPAG